MTLYMQHFGLKEAPFKITPTTEFFYGGGRRGEILHALQYAIDVGEGIMMVTGEVGSGKTMLLRTLSGKLMEHVDLVYIANPSLSGREILYNICEELGLKIDVERPDAVRRLQDYLIKRHTEGKRVVALIDEAQAMPDESLEEIRLLSNLETSRHKLLQIVLFGQPELQDKLSRQNMRQLRERITVILQLEPFSRDDIREYISTRLHAAGYNSGELFAKDGCQLLAAVSQGLSRRINVLADKAMLSAFERGAERVLYEDVRRAVKDAKFGRMRYRSEQARRMSRQLTIGVTVAAVAVLIIAIGSRLGGTEIGGTEIPIEATVAQPLNAVPVTAAVIVQVPLTVTVQAAPVVSVVTVTAAVTTTPAADILSVIVASQRGEGVDSEQLAEEIAALAETQKAAPQSEGGNNDWKSTAIRRAGLIDNERWGWMPEASYLRLRLNATQTWLEKNGGKGYTARLLTVGQERGVFLERFLRHFADFYPLRNLMVYPLRLSDKDRFVVTFGVYATQEDAEIYINNMPRYFIGGRPFAQPLAASTAEAAGHW